MWNKVNKPSVSNWNRVTSIDLAYDDPNTTYSQATAQYDGSIGSNWNKVLKPIISNWSVGASAYTAYDNANITYSESTITYVQ